MYSPEHSDETTTRMQPILASIMLDPDVIVVGNQFTIGTGLPSDEPDVASAVYNWAIPVPYVVPLAAVIVVVACANSIFPEGPAGHPGSSCPSCVGHPFHGIDLIRVFAISPE
jgi:hypothetical protein